MRGEAAHIRSMQPLSHPPVESLSLERVLHALGDVARLMMFRTIAASDGIACGEVCALQPRSTLSHNTRILREAGLIRSERRGKSLINHARIEDLNARFPGLLDVVLKP
jgi:DNA-binding transcriptional ArsR family regulator